MADLHFRDPREVQEYLERLQRAQSILGAGADPPPNSLAAQAIERAAQQGIDLSFHHVLTDDGLLWEMRVHTARGELTPVRPEINESWVDVLDREGFIDRDHGLDVCERNLKKRPDYSVGLGTPARFVCECGREFEYEDDEAEGAQWTLVKGHRG